MKSVIHYRRVCSFVFGRENRHRMDYMNSNPEGSPSNRRKEKSYDEGHDERKTGEADYQLCNTHVFGNVVSAVL